MKTPNSDRPRLTCRLTRSWIAIRGDAGIASRHVESCDACRAYFGACDALENALRRDAVLEMQAALVGFERRVMEAIDRAESPRRERRSWTPVISLATAAACVALAITFYPKPEPAPATPTSADVSETIAAAFAFVQTAPANAWGSFKPKAEQVFTQNPLQEEAELVYADAQRAVRFLAMNFLPTVPEMDAPPRTPARADNSIGG